MVSEKNLTLKLEGPEKLELICDVNQLIRVFDNLLRNAYLYSYENTEIRIGVKKSDDSVEISFANRGKTIEKEKLDRIFEQFFRLDKSRNSKEGTGLGLAIAYQIVKLHGGEIVAESFDENIIFRLRLPLVGKK